MCNWVQNTFSGTTFIIFELVSAISLILASILLIIQGIDNDNFKNYKTREAKIERFILSQFSFEIYSNIKSHAFLNENNSKNNLNIELKLKPFYDCRDVKDEELNEIICQDKIINNYTCCRPECCTRENNGKVFCYNYNFNLSNPDIINYKVLNYDDEEIIEDPRLKFCTYYNTYEKDININTLFNGKIKISQYKYNYSDLLLNNNTDVCIGTSQCRKDYIDCGIIDTLNRHLYAENESLCPVNNIEFNSNDITINNDLKTPNNKKIIIRNIISEILPTAHEYKNHRECRDMEIKNEPFTIKDIYKFIKPGKNIYNKMENLEISMNQIRNIEFNENNQNQKLYWYTTNYIGFKTSEDLQKFNKYFNSSDYKINLLYSIGLYIYPYYEPIIIMFPLIAIFVIYIIILVLSLCKLINILFIFFIIKFSISIAMLIIEIIFYLMATDEFKEIKIEMDENYKEILDLYNKRRFQLKYLLSIIFVSFSFILLIIFLLIKYTFMKKDKSYILINKESFNHNNEKISKNINNKNTIENSSDRGKIMVLKENIGDKQSNLENNKKDITNKSINTSNKSNKNNSKENKEFKNSENNNNNISNDFKNNNDKIESNNIENIQKIIILSNDKSEQDLDEDIYFENINTENQNNINKEEKNNEINNGQNNNPINNLLNMDKKDTNNVKISNNENGNLETAANNENNKIIFTNKNESLRNKIESVSSKYKK